MSYFIQDAVNEYQQLHKLYRFLGPSSGPGSSTTGGTQAAIGAGARGGVRAGVTTTANTGFGAAPGPDNASGFWHLADTGWTWIAYDTGPAGGDTGGSFSGGGGRTLAEDLAYMEAKYGWDEKLEIKVLETEYGLRGKFEDERFKDAKELQSMSARDRLIYLREEIGLTKTMKLELMIEQNGYDVIMQDDRQEFETLMAANDQDFRAGESLLNRELEERMQGLDIESREALAAARIAAEQAMQAAGFGHAEKMQAGGFAHDEKMQGAGFVHDLKMQAGQQAFDKVMQERGFANDRFLQERELTMRLTINSNNIESSEKIAENKITADKEMQDKQIAFEKEQKEEDRKLRRFEVVNELRGKDPVRAALMAMGAGDDLDAFGGAFAGLGPMEGAEQLQADTESALMGIEGLGAAGQQITLGGTGVEGLQSVEKAGTAFVQSGLAGDTATKTLVRSAQGVGGSKQAGVSNEAVEERIAAITPKGFNTQRAAGGIGPHVLTAMDNQEYAARGRGKTQYAIDAPAGSGTAKYYADHPELTPNSPTFSAEDTQIARKKLALKTRSDARRLEMTTRIEEGKKWALENTRPANAPVAVEADRPDVEPNTSYTVGEGLGGDGTRPEVVTTGANKELLSIEPATNDRGRGDNRSRGHPKPTPAPPDTIAPTIAPIADTTKETPIVAQQQQVVEQFKLKQAKQMQDEMKREGINPEDMKQIQAIKASGQPLSPAQEQILARYDRIVGQYQMSIQNFEKQTLTSGGAPPVPELVPTTPGAPGAPATMPPITNVSTTAPRGLGGINTANDHIMTQQPALGGVDASKPQIGTASGTPPPRATEEDFARLAASGGGIGQETVGPTGFNQSEVVQRAIERAMGGGLMGTSQVMSDRRRAYMESLPPAQQAAIRQSQQQGLASQQDQLIKNLTPETIQKLMQLINNPGRQVNANLQEQLPQLRDGAGNLQTSGPRGLAQIV